MKPVSYKRILAYLIDIFIVICIATILTMFIPVSEEYTNQMNELNAVLEDYSSGDISETEYLEKFNDISYIINKESVQVSIVSVVLSTIYFVVLAYYMNGQTFGKKIMKIQVVSANSKKLTMNNYLIRSLIVDSILMNAISIIAILFLEKSSYLKVYDVTSTIFGAIYVVIFAMILFRQDGRGLHDLLANTKVISLNDKKVLNEETIKEEKKETKKEVIKDAEIIEKE